MRVRKEKPEQLNTEPTPGQCWCPSSLSPRSNGEPELESLWTECPELEAQETNCSQWAVNKIPGRPTVVTESAPLVQQSSKISHDREFCCVFFALNVHTCSTLWLLAPAAMLCWVMCVFYSELVQITLLNVSRHLKKNANCISTV